MPGTRRSSLVGAVLLVALGMFFLYSNFRPGLDPWPLLSRYWPVLLIFLGLGKVWDHLRPRDPSQAGGAWLGGGEIAVILLLVIAGIALSFQTASRKIHEVETIERQGSEPVQVHIQMPAGELKLSGGAGKLMEADFNYDEAEGKPEISYHVSGDAGRLDVTQPGKKFHMGPTPTTGTCGSGTIFRWSSRLKWARGRSELVVGDSRSTGSKSIWEQASSRPTSPATGKKDLDAEIHGGVGHAIIYLPVDVGVRVHATGGIGSISAGGLKRDGDEYVNELYGKSPVTLRLDVSAEWEISNCGPRPRRHSRRPSDSRLGKAYSSDESCSAPRVDPASR